MSSTFFGLEIARRALFTQQSALHVTSHNIANTHTEGYSRQRVDFAATQPFPAAARNRPEIAGQLGTGVKAGDIVRVRDNFLDLQFRGENSKAGFWSAKADSLRRMEDVMNEPSDLGLAAVMNQFWSSLQELATHPEDEGARKVVAQRAAAVTDTFNYLNETLGEIQGDIEYQLSTEVDQVNSLLSQIGELNRQIAEVEPHGYLPNDLYDQRDVLIDQLSERIDIEVSLEPNGGRAKANAEGQAVITAIINGTEYELIDDENELQGFDFSENGIGIGEMEDGTVTVGEDDYIALEDFTNIGSLRGHIESLAFYDEQLGQLDSMADALVEAFNEQHQLGTDFEGNTGEDEVTDFFTNEGGGAGNIAVNEAIMENVNLIAASGDGSRGNGENAIELAGVKDASIEDLDDRSVQAFYEGMIGELGVRAEEANRLMHNSGVLRESVDQNRQSISGVSLDEEMSNLVQFQHAYNAAARSMTVVDEMLDRIINQMGIVGR